MHKTAAAEAQHTICFRSSSSDSPISGEEARASKSQIGSHRGDCKSRKKPTSKSRHAEENPGALSWINIGGPADLKDAQTKTMIRSHVMRDFKSKVRSQTADTHTLNRRIPKSKRVLAYYKKSDLDLAFDAADGILTCATGPHISTRVSLAQRVPAPILQTEELAADSQRLGHLVCQYLEVWMGEQASRLCGSPSGSRWRAWVPMVLEDDVLLHAQAFCAFVHLNPECKEPWNQQRLTLKSQAIERINRRLDDNALALMDQTVASVLLMATIAHCENLQYYTTHINGLRKMINLRGGFLILRANKWQFTDFVSMVDYVGSLIYHTEPQIVPPKPLGVRNLPAHFDERRLYLGHGALFTPLPRLNRETLRLIDDMYALTMMLEGIPHDIVLQNSKFAQECTRMERRLRLLPSSDDPIRQFEATRQRPNLLFESYRLAALIYFEALYHLRPFGDAANLETLQSLRVSVEKTISCGWDRYPGVLIWVLAVGTAAERGSPELVIAEHLSRTCCAIMDWVWPDVEDILSNFMHAEKLVETKAEGMSKNRDTGSWPAAALLGF